MKTKFFLLLIVLIISFLFALKIGEVDIGWNDIFTVLKGGEGLLLHGSVIKDIRLPRIFIALIVGAGLAVSGVIFQSILRNPLAEPYTLGVSGGACLGVALAMVFLNSSSFFMLPLLGWFGAMFSVYIVYFLASRRGFSNTSLILSGIVLNFLFSSLVLIVFAFLKPSRVQSMILWLMGDLSASNKIFVKTGFFIIVPCLLITLWNSKKLDILGLGDEKAYSLGLNVNREKKYFFFLASTITATCISISGVIGFIGLLIPHLMRKFFGFSNPAVLLASSLGGAVFLLLSDTVARVIISPLELPVGVITGLLGGVFFLVLLILKGGWKIG